MYPVLFSVGDYPIHSYGAMGAVGFLIVCLFTLLRARALSLDTNHVVDVIFWGSIAGLVGSRLVYVAQNPAHFQTIGDVLNIRGGGLVFYGAMLVGIPVGTMIIWYRKLPFFDVWDALATGMPLGHAATRMGCFLAGCCHGTVTDASWAVTFTHELSSAPQGMPLHPTQLYEAASLFFIGLIVNVFYSRRKFPGQAMALYLGLYAVFRSIIEVFRGDLDRGFFLESLLGETLSFSQGFSIVVAIVAFSVFLGLAQRIQRARA